MTEVIRFEQLKNPVVLFASGFGAGCAPIAPGTAGTMVAIPFVYVIQMLGLNMFVAATVAISLLGILICGLAAKQLGVHDHPGIVFDEIAGYFVTMIAAPDGWVWIVIGFVLFRLFDILKPWPISWLDRRVSGGFGIMLDDIVAGMFALVCMQLAVHYMAL